MCIRIFVFVRTYYVYIYMCENGELNIFSLVRDLAPFFLSFYLPSRVPPSLVLNGPERRAPPPSDKTAKVIRKAVSKLPSSLENADAIKP